MKFRNRRSDTAIGHCVTTRSRSKLLLLTSNRGDGGGGGGSGSVACCCGSYTPDLGLAFADDNNNNHNILKTCQCRASMDQAPCPGRGRGVLKRHKSNSSSTTALFPDHVIFSILVLLPADVLHNVIRYVCWSWYRLISDPVFVREHLRRQCSSSPGLRLGFLGLAYPAFKIKVHVELINKGEFQMTESPFPFVGQVMATCDGLVVLDDLMWKDKQRRLYVANPITREKVTLPPLQNRSLVNMSSCALAYATSIACYKVFQVTSEEQLQVHTLGIDSVWRVIDTNNAQRLRISVWRLNIKHCIDSYMYWFGGASPSYILALDINSETVRMIPTPLDRSSYYRAQPMTMDRWLCLVDFKYISYGEVWALTCLEQVNWTKMFTIQMDSLARDIENVSPLLFSHCKAQLIFCSPTGEVAFKVHGRSLGFVWHDVKTGYFKVYHSDRKTYRSFFNAHINSLVSPRRRF